MSNVEQYETNDNDCAVVEEDH